MRSKFYSATLLVGSVLVACASPADSDIPVSRISRAETASDTSLINAIEAFIPEVMRAKGTPGLNIAVARRGKVIWEAGFGYANLENKTPMTPQTVFHSGSMGKTYTATATMQLVEQGVLGLDDPINRHFTEFKVTNPLGDREITVRDLLTHRTGLASNAAHSEFLPPKPLGDHLEERYAQEMFPPFEGTVIPRWTAKVGETFQYSNFGMATLGYLVEVTNPEGLSFSEYVQKHIMDPLGMTSSMFPPVQDAAHVRPEIVERFSTGYVGLGAVHMPTPTIYFADYPAGTVVSTPGEHILLLLAYLNQGTYDGHELLKPETVELMLTPQVDAFGGTYQLGLTWLLANVGAPDFNFSHGGAHMYGWNNDFRAYPDLDVAVAIATNHWRLPTVALDRENVMIADFIASWLQQHDPAEMSDPLGPSWAWKTSYVMGLIIAEELKGALGIRSPITPEMMDAMIAGAKVGVDAADHNSAWDPEGFREGMDDMLSVQMTPEAIRAFLESDRIRVTPEEREQIERELGSRGLPAFSASF